MAKELSGNMTLIFAGKVKRLNSWLQIHSDLCGFLHLSTEHVWKVAVRQGESGQKVLGQDCRLGRG